MDFKMYHQATLFYGLSTVIPWMFWFSAGYVSHIDSSNNIPQQSASILAFIGLLAPVGIAIFISRNNKALLSDLKQRFFNFRGINMTFIVLAVLLMPLSILLAQGISLLFGYSIEQFQLAKSFSFNSGVFPVWFMLIIAPLIEELAWHSYGTDCLRARLNLFKTSMLFALFWGVWHFPLASIKDYYHSNLMEDGWIYSLNFLVSIFPFVIIMNWIYYKANRNIILPIIFHIAAGYFNEVFATHPMSKVFQTCLLSAIAGYVIYNDKNFFFNQKTIKS